MKIHKYTEQELKMTATLYVPRKEVVEHIHSSGNMPSKISLGGFPIAMNFISRRLGDEGSLTANEQLVYDAILRENRLATGGVILFPDSPPIYYIELNQKIQLCESPRDIDWD